MAVFVAQVWGRLASLVLAAAVARQLGATALGMYILVITLVSIIGELTDIGLGTLLTREIARTQKTKNYHTLLSTFFWLKVLLSLGGYLFVAGLSGTGLFPGETAKLLLVGGVVLVPDAVNGVVGAYFNGRQQMEIPNGIHVVSRTMSLGGGLYALGQGHGLAGVLLAGVFASLAGAVLHGWVLSRLGLFPLLRPQVSMWRRVVLDAAPFAVTSLIAAVYTRVDLVLLGILSGNLAAGWYGAAYKLWDAARLIPNSILNAVFPEISRLWSTPTGKEKLRNRFRNMQAAALFAGMGLAAVGMILANPLVRGFFGTTDSQAAVWSFQLLVCALPAMFLYLLNGYWLYAAGKQQRVMAAMGIVGVFNVVLNLLLIPRWSVLGAASVALCSEWLLWVLLQRQVRRVLYDDPNTFPTGGYISAQAAVADLDGDGELEIIAGSDALYVWKKGGALLSGFPAHGKNFFASRPVVGDFDGDGEPEILVGCDDDALYAFNRAGYPLPGWPVQTGGDVYSSPALFPHPGKPGLGVVVGSDDGLVYAWDAAGEQIPGWPQPTYGFVSASPALADLDGDGQMEIVVGSWDRKVYAWKLDGSPLPGWPQRTGHFVWSGAAVGNLQKNDMPGVVAASDKVYAWDAQGSPLPGWPKPINSYCTGLPALGDLDGDGQLEVIVGADRLYGWRANGSIIPGFPLDLGTFLWGTPTLGDVEGDGQVEIVVGGWDGRIYVIGRNAEIKSSFSTQGPVLASPTLADLDGGGKPAIIVGSWDKQMYIFYCSAAAQHAPADVSELPRKAFPQVLPAGGFKRAREFQATFVAFDCPISPQAVMYYHADFEKDWHPVPLVVHQDRLTGLIQPFLKGIKVIYYAEIGTKLGIQRLPAEGTYSYEVIPDWTARISRRLGGHMIFL